MGKKVYPKARKSIHFAIIAILLMVMILFIKIKWIFAGGLFISFFLSIYSVISGIRNLIFISRNKEIYSGDSLSWITICIGVIAFLSTLPFVVTLFLTACKQAFF
ncbi:MAG: hypothetical protein U0W24_14625 [Bacteroidales bacterium]